MRENRLEENFEECRIPETVQIRPKIRTAKLPPKPNRDESTSGNMLNYREDEALKGRVPV